MGLRSNVRSSVVGPRRFGQSRFELVPQPQALDPGDSPRKRAPRGTTARAVKNQSLENELLRIGGNLTWRQVSSFFREADQGRIYDLVNLAHEARQKDGHLHGILSVREDALNGLEWRLSGSTPEIRDFISEQLKRLDAAVDDADESLSFSGMIEHLQSANYFGFSCSELQWAKDGRFLVPDKIWPISHRRFAYRESDGVLVQRDRDASATDAGVRLLHDFASGNFVQHQPRITGDVGPREGLMHVLTWAALFRNWTLKDWLQMAELGWKPWRWAAYSKNLGDQEIEDLKLMLSYMSSTNIGVLSKDIDLNVEWPRNTGSSSGGSSSHRELKTYLAKEMSKAVLGATDVLEPADVGSMAAVRIREKRPMAKRAIDGERLGRTTRRHLIAPMVRFNYGVNAEVPEFRFITQEPTDIETFGKGVSELVGSGVRMSETWVRDMVGAKEPKDDNDTITVPGTVEEGETEEDGTSTKSDDVSPEAG